jgi:hypothetical protein
MTTANIRIAYTELWIIMVLGGLMIDWDSSDSIG